MNSLYPLPDNDAIAKTKELYLNQLNIELTDEQAAEVLSRVMRFVYLTSELCSATPSTPESPRTTKAA